MASYKSLSAVFIVLAVIFAASTGYLMANPSTVTQAIAQTMTETVTQPFTGPPALAQTPAANPAGYSVIIAYKPSIGFYLANGTGWTLYRLTKDIPTNMTSNCVGKCIKIWPAFYASGLSLPPGLNASSFVAITRQDGAKQLTYDGWPLYYFMNDTKPGDTNGQGVAKVWFVLSLPTPTMLLTGTALQLSDDQSTTLGTNIPRLS